MSDIIEAEEVDKDTVESEVLEEQFSKKYKILTESAVSLKRSYINKLHGSKSLKLAVSLTENAIEVYQLSDTSLKCECRLSGHEDSPTEVVWSPIDEHLLYSSGEDGCCKLWDTRTGKPSVEYKGEDNEKNKPFECMDVSSSGAIICAGSRVVKSDSYIVFWDYRKPTPLGGYWNSHTNDITQVKFHRENTETLVTGSLDGLVNVFNMMEESEEDALVYTCNIENSVEKMSWLDGKRLACLTQSNDLQIWDTDTGDMLNSYTRDKIAKTIRRSREDDCYLVDAFKPTGGAPVLLAGSYGGNGDVLRSVSVRDKKLHPATNFVHNKQIVRCMWHHAQRDLIVTAGESGIITVWSPGEPAGDAATASKLSKAPVKPHGNRHKPY